MSAETVTVHSCAIVFSCPVPHAGHMMCKACGKEYVFCKQHKPWAKRCMNGHVLRVHPDAVPDLIDQLIKNPAEMQGIYDQHRGSPELWENLVLAIEEAKKRAQAS